MLKNESKKTHESHADTFFSFVQASFFIVPVLILFFLKLLCYCLNKIDSFTYISVYSLYVCCIVHFANTHQIAKINNKGLLWPSF